MKLSHNLDIYNNVVAIYYWENNDVFGVEIENEKVAETQRSIWNTMWKLAEKYKLPEKYKGFTHSKPTNIFDPNFFVACQGFLGIPTKTFKEKGVLNFTQGL